MQSSALVHWLCQPPSSAHDRTSVAPQVPALLELITERKHDDEFVLQIAFTFQKLLMFPETRNVLINQTDVSSARTVEVASAPWWTADKPALARGPCHPMLHVTRRCQLRSQAVSYLVDLLFDPNKEVRRTAGKAIDTVMDFDEEWAVRIRDLKFQRYNAQWLKTLEIAGGVSRCVCMVHHVR